MGTVYVIVNVELQSNEFQIHVSRKWGFTKWDREVYEPMRADGRLVPDGVTVQYKPHHGPLAKWMAAQG